MKKRITLTIDEKCIAHAKAFAMKEGKTVSQLVEDYFAAYTKPLKPLQQEEMSPLTRSLLGILEGAEIKEYKEYRKEYMEFLEEKHR